MSLSEAMIKPELLSHGTIECSDIAATRRFLTAGEVETLEGTVIPLEAKSICVHGDGPTAAAIVDRVIAVLDELGHPLRAATAAQTKDVNA